MKKEKRMEFLEKRVETLEKELNKIRKVVFLRGEINEEYRLETLENRIDDNTARIEELEGGSE